MYHKTAETSFMNSIKQLIATKKENVLSIYFTSGFPQLEDTTSTITALGKSGVDFIEVGLPYSDPLADGPTIQNSSLKALKNGINLDIVFSQLVTVQKTNTTPLVIMGYLNQLLTYGEERFCEKLVACGIDTVIIPDLPMIAYEQHYKALFDRYGISNVFLITPHTSEERIRKIDELSTSFIYMVASAAITGAKGEISKEQEAYFNRINSMKLNNPLMIGFGISDHHTFSKACQFAQGAIIGSAFIQYVDQNGVASIPNFIEAIRGN